MNLNVIHLLIANKASVSILFIVSNKNASHNNIERCAVFAYFVCMNGGA